MVIEGAYPAVMQQIAGNKSGEAQGVVDQEGYGVDEEKRYDEPYVASCKLQNKLLKGTYLLKGCEVTGYDAEAVKRKVRVHQYGKRGTKQELKLRAEVGSDFTHGPEDACEVGPENDEAEYIFEGIKI